MRIAVSATGPTLDAEVDPRFGRCQYLIFADTDTMQIEVEENASIAASGGAGIATAQAVASKGVQAMLTGNTGPNAFQVLSQAGIQVITGVSGKVQDAIERLKAGEFQAAPQPNVDAHFGMGAGGGVSPGMGGGFSTGGGRGRGRGMGRGMGMEMSPVPPDTPHPANPQSEIEALKGQAQMMKQQLDDIMRRIDDIEKKGG